MQTCHSPGILFHQSKTSVEWVICGGHYTNAIEDMIGKKNCGPALNKSRKKMEISIIYVCM